MAGDGRRVEDHNKGESLPLLHPAYIALVTVLLGGPPGEGGPWPSRGTRPPREAVALRGRVVVRAAAVDVPVAYARLQLLGAGRVIASTATDRQGEFKFVRDLPRGRYQLVLDPSDYEGELEVTIGERTPEVVLLARRRPRWRGSEAGERAVDSRWSAGYFGI